MYFLKRAHVCTRMKLGLVQSPAYNIDTVYFMDWSFWVESWTGVLEWNLGWSWQAQSTSHALFLGSVAFPILFCKERNTDKADVFSTSLFSLINWFYITSGSVVMPSGHFREYILHLTMASRHRQAFAYHSHQHRMQNYHFVYRSWLHRV